jgi:hypothetical protein
MKKSHFLHRRPILKNFDSLDKHRLELGLRTRKGRLIFVRQYFGLCFRFVCSTRMIDSKLVCLIQNV